MISSTHLSVSTARCHLRVAGLLHANEDARVALNLLSPVNSRLDALKVFLPNLEQTLEALQSVLLLRVRQSDPTRLKPAPMLVSRSATSNFIQWLVKDAGIGIKKHHDSDWLDIMAFRWLCSAAFRSFGDQLAFDPTAAIDSPDRELRSLVAAKLSCSAVEFGYSQWLSKVSELAPDSTLPQMANLLSRIIELPFHAPAARIPKPLPRLTERQLLKGYWHHMRPGQHHKLIELLNRDLIVNFSEIKLRLSAKGQKTRRASS